jgi:hypothetical protein
VLPGPWGSAATIASRAGPQAVVGAAQGGVTQGLQNLIAQQVYDGDQSVLDGVAGSVWRGGLINGVAAGAPAVRDFMGLVEPALRAAGDAPAADAPYGAQPPILMPAPALPWLRMSDAPGF